MRAPSQQIAPEERIPRTKTRKPGITLVHLYEIELQDGTIHRLTSFGDTTIGFAGEDYLAQPIEASGFSWNGKGTPGRPELKIANRQGYFLHGMEPPYLVGSKVKRIVTFLEECDAPHGEGGGACFTPEAWQVERISRLDENEITLALAPEASIDAASLPIKVMLKDLCQHTYRVYDPEKRAFDYTRASCPYRGGAYFDSNGNPTTKSQDQCSLRLGSGCKKRFSNESLPFLGFPGLGDF